MANSDSSPSTGANFELPGPGWEPVMSAKVTEVARFVTVTMGLVSHDKHLNWYFREQLAVGCGVMGMSLARSRYPLTGAYSVVGPFVRRSRPRSSTGFHSSWKSSLLPGALPGRKTRGAPPCGLLVSSPLYRSSSGSDASWYRVSELSRQRPSTELLSRLACTRSGPNRSTSPASKSVL